VSTLMPHTIVPAQQDTQKRLHGTSRARRPDDRMLQAVIRLIHQGPADESGPPAGSRRRPPSQPEDALTPEVKQARPHAGTLAKA